MNSETKKIENLDNENVPYVKTIYVYIQNPNLDEFLLWGASNFREGQTIEVKPKPMVMFDVNTSNFVGNVCIYYNWANYYEIDFMYNNQVVQHYEVDGCMVQSTISNFLKKHFFIVTE